MAMPDLDALQTWLRTQLPDEATYRIAPIGDHRADLFPQEAELLEKAVDKRVREFSTGRVLARAALKELGHAASPILIGDQRKPLWPDGISASITHSQQICAVVAARSKTVRGIGLDLEGARGVGNDVARYVSTADELARNANEVPGAALNAVVFSIREAIFKAYYPLTGAYLNFGDVSLDLDGRDGRFVARIINDEQPALLGQRWIDGHFLVTDQLVLSLVVV